MEIMTTLAAGLGAILAVAKPAAILVLEIEKIVGAIDRMADRQRTNAEIRTVRRLCDSMRALTVGKGDIGFWIERYEGSASDYPETWQDVLIEFGCLSEELEEIRRVLLQETFSSSALAAEMAVQADKASKIFAQMQKLPCPKGEEEMQRLRDIGAIVRQIQNSGIAALEKVDGYQAQLRDRLVGR